MKRCSISQLLSLVALLLVVAQVLVGCNVNKNTENTDTMISDNSTDTVEALNLLPITKDGKSLYCIVYDYDGIKETATLARQLVAKITELTEYKVDVRAYSSKNIANAEGYKRMYIGAVAGYTDEAYNTLKRNDYRVDIMDGDVIFGGYDYEKLYLAVGYFYDALLYKDGELYIDLDKADIGRSSTYMVADMTVGDKSIGEYSIVYRDVYSRAYAEKLAEIIGDVAGYVIPVVADTFKETENELIIGITNRNADDQPISNGYRISVDGNKVKFIAGDDTSAEMMTAYLLSKIKATKYTETFDFSSAMTEVSGEDTVRMMTFNVWNAWGSDVGARGAQIANMLLANNLDIICLQEYDTSFRRSANNLQTPLAARYAEVTVDGVDSDNVWNPIFYNKYKYELVECGMMDMYAEGINCIEYTYPDGDGRSHFRTFVWAVLRDKITNQIFLIGNLHYSVSQGPPPNGGDHKAESDFIMAGIDEIRARYADAIVLVAGDYNSTVSDRACSYMINAGYASTLKLAALKGTDDNDIQIGDGIDNILTIADNSSDIEVQVAVALHEGDIVNFSDHLPVVIQFRTK